MQIIKMEAMRLEREIPRFNTLASFPLDDWEYDQTFPRHRLSALASVVRITSLWTVWTEGMDSVRENHRCLRRGKVERDSCG